MTGLVLPTFLTDEDNDYVEELRGTLFPRLHWFLDTFTPAYGVGTADESQYAGTLAESEAVIEKELAELGLVRNPLACYKETEDGRESEGSWALIAERDECGLLRQDDRQLHITLFSRRDGAAGREVYAHLEADWRDRPLAHIRCEDFHPVVGAERTKRLLNQYSYLTLE